MKFKLQQEQLSGCNPVHPFQQPAQGGGFQSWHVNPGVLSPGRLKSMSDPRNVMLSTWTDCWWDRVGALHITNYKWKGKGGGIAMIFLCFYFFSLQKWWCEVPEACASMHGYENAHLQFLPQDCCPWESLKEIQRYVEMKPGHLK